MGPLTNNNIESELSYAYLHAVASRVGASCKYSNRHDDNAGIDATLTSWGPFPDTYRQEVDVKIQLKATTQTPSETKTDHLSYFFKGTPQYNDLCRNTYATPRILVVMFLPEDNTQWLELNEDRLLLRKCAYWVSLRNAPESSNKTGETVYLPKHQRFDPQGLKTLLTRIASNDVPAFGEKEK